MTDELPGTPVIVWRCPKGCRLLRVKLSPHGYFIERFWSGAPKTLTTPHAGLMTADDPERRHLRDQRATSPTTRPTRAVVWLPLDLTLWPPLYDSQIAQRQVRDNPLNLRCQHGEHGSIALESLLEDVAILREKQAPPVTRTIC